MMSATIRLEKLLQVCLSDDACTNSDSRRSSVGLPDLPPVSDVDDELITLHIELEIDNEHAVAENEIITKSLAEVLGLSSSDVYFRGVDKILQNEEYIGLFQCNISTTQNEVDDLVSMIYNTIQTQELHRKIQQHWQETEESVLPTIEIRKLYESDPEKVELHFQFEIDPCHAFQKNQIIKKCIAEVLTIPYSHVYVDRIEQIYKPELYGLYCGHIPTTRHEIENLVSLLYHYIQINQELQRKIEKYSCINNEKAVVEVKELYETDHYAEDYNMCKYNINQINKRLELNEKYGYDRIKTFSMQIYYAMKVLINESEFTFDMIKEILLYSNHEQVINKWYNICSKLGPFAYLISDKTCTINLIQQFEQKANYNLPLNIRVSLMICDSIQCPIIVDCSNSNFQECVILPIKNWKCYGEEGDDHDIYSFDNKLYRMFNEDLNIYKDLGFINGCNTYVDMVLIGYCCGTNTNGSVVAMAILNMFNNKVLTEIENVDTKNIDQKIFDFDNWFMNPYYMYNYKSMCLLSANHCLADRDDYDNALFCTVDEIRYFLFKSKDLCITKTNDEIIYNYYNFNSYMDVYYDLHISNMYEMKYNPLIYGYIRNIESILLMKSVPICVIDMIWQCFPFFVEDEQWNMLK